MARAMRLTFLDLALPCILFLAAVVCASEVPVATSPIITTVTQTDAQLSATTIGTSVSTATSTCSDGSCIAISLVSVPIVSTITVLSGSTYVSTVGYTTIYSSAADVVDSTTRLTSLATTTPSASTSATPSPTTTQVSLTTIFLTSSPISQTQLSTLSSTLKTSTQGAGVSQTSTSSSQDNSSNSNSPGREASHNGLSAATKAAIAIVTVLAVSAAIFLAFWLGKRQSRKAAASVEEAKPGPEEIVPGGIIEKGGDDSSNNSGRSETLGSSAHGRPYEMGATSPTPLGRAVPVIASVELADDNAAAEQRPITTTQHTRTHANAEREAQLVAAFDSMQHELAVARNRRSGIAGGVVELGDGRRRSAPPPRTKLVDLDGMIGPRRASRIVDADAGVPVELMGNERFEKG